MDIRINKSISIEERIEKYKNELYNILKTKPYANKISFEHDTSIKDKTASENHISYHFNELIFLLLHVKSRNKRIILTTSYPQGICDGIKTEILIKEIYNYKNMEYSINVDDFILSFENLIETISNIMIENTTKLHILRNNIGEICKTNGFVCELDSLFLASYTKNNIYLKIIFTNYKIGHINISDTSRKTQEKINVDFNINFDEISYLNTFLLSLNKLIQY